MRASVARRAGRRKPARLAFKAAAFVYSSQGNGGGHASAGRQGADVQVLIVEHNRDLARIWAAFLGRQGMECRLAASLHQAYAALRAQSFEALVLEMELPDGAALAVADFATYRNPEIPIIAVTARGFFSDSAIFELIPNARGLLRAPLRPEDMAALVEHYGARSATAGRDGASGG